jgi:ABC-type dipeptide/oligopeptide/nickel transport system ATPase component
MGILERPELLIADEPTTALDVTLEAQIVQLLRDLRREMNASILFISHNLGLIAELCDFVVVLYAGEVVEQGTVRDIFHRPQHPYTQALLECDPARIEEIRRELPTISGDVPNLLQIPVGCVRAALPQGLTAAWWSIRRHAASPPSRRCICWRRRPVA